MYVLKRGDVYTDDAAGWSSIVFTDKLQSAKTFPRASDILSYLAHHTDNYEWENCEIVRVECVGEQWVEVEVI